MNMKLLLFALMMSVSAFAEEKSQNLKLYPGFRTLYVEGDDIKSRIFGYTFLTEYSKQLEPRLKFDFAARVVLETGSNEVVGNVEEFKPNETINLNYGYMSYNILEPLTLKLGAFNQLLEFNSPLLIGFNAFAGAIERVELGKYFYFQAMQTIPNNNRLTKRIGTVDQGTPFFGMETFGAKFGEDRFLQLELGHYTYRDISSKIAEKSKEFGNSTSGIGEQTEFLYAFEGYNLMLNSQIPVKDWGVRVGGQYLYNDKAPTGRNLGYLVRLGVYKREYELFLENYRNESDTSPSFYNSRMYGHNNITGGSVGLNYNSSKYQVLARYTQFNPIEENAVQTKTDIFLLSFSYQI